MSKRVVCRYPPDELRHTHVLPLRFVADAVDQVARRPDY